MVSNYRVAITCTDTTILQTLVGLLQGPECKITEENGEYFWSSSLFETLPNGSEVAKKADQLLPELNGLVRLRLGNAHKIVRGEKVSFTNESGGTGQFLELSFSAQVTYTISGNEEKEEQRKQQWVALVGTWAKQEINSLDTLNNALIHFGEEVSWNSLYSTYETIKEDCKGFQDGQLLFNQWMVVNGKNREKDFTESANNAYISGVLAARHSLAKSFKVKEIEGSPYVEVTNGRDKKEQILPMSLHEAKDFVASLLSQWIMSK